MKSSRKVMIQPARAVSKLRVVLGIGFFAVLVFGSFASQIAAAPPVLAGKGIARENARLTTKELVDQGYVIRGDSWSGEALVGGRVGIRHQLFKGNEYVFTLGTAIPVEFQMAIFTKNREPLQGEMKTSPETLSIRVNPTETGTYLIVFTLTSETKERIPWALVYAYR